MPTSDWLKRRWQKSLEPGDQVVVVGSAHFDLILPNSPKIQSTGVIIVGQKSIAMAVDALRRSPINTVRLSRSDVFINVEEGRGLNLIGIESRKGGSYVLSSVDPFVEVRDALVSGLRDVTDETPAAKSLQAVKAAAGTDTITRTGYANYLAAPGQPPQTVIMAVTPQRALWRPLSEDAAVLSLVFADVVDVQKVDPKGQNIRFTHHTNPDGALVADFIFHDSMSGLDLRQAVLDWANASISSRQAGEVLASGDGFMEARDEWKGTYAERVEARESAMVVHCSGKPPKYFPYSAAARFNVRTLRGDQPAGEALGAWSRAVWISLDDGSLKEWCQLWVRTDDLDRWQVILEHFQVPK